MHGSIEYVRFPRTGPVPHAVLGFRLLRLHDDNPRTCDRGASLRIASVFSVTNLLVRSLLVLCPCDAHSEIWACANAHAAHRNRAARISRHPLSLGATTRADAATGCIKQTHPGVHWGGNAPVDSSA